MARKTERLLNLLIMLLAQRAYVDRDRIRREIYPDAGDDAFDKMFERDKDELRSLGIPIEVGSQDAFFDDEVGYRIRSESLTLPDIELTADEAAVVGLASRVWEHATLAEAASAAARRITAYDDAVEPAEVLQLGQPRVGADEPSFDAFWQAALTRTAVTFEHSRAGQPPQTRHLEPWGVVRFSGRWYVVGRDTDRDAERVFRLSRVLGEPTLVGRPGAYQIPPGTDVRAVAERLAPTVPAEPAVVLARTGAAVPLRRRASSIDPGVSGAGEGVWDRLELPAGAWSAEELLTFGPDVVALSPASLREDVVARLRALVGP